MEREYCSLYADTAVILCGDEEAEGEGLYYGSIQALTVK